jgi:hypothetical protein
MKEARSKIFEGNLLDQDYVGNATIVAGLKQCALSTRLFIAHCHASRNPNGLVKNVVTYHTSCLSGFQQKKSHMLKFLKHVKDRDETKIGFTL